MFNFYPVAVRYRCTPGIGILRGQPMECTLGVPSRKAARDKIDELKKRQDGALYDNFSIDYRK